MFENANILRERKTIPKRVKEIIMQLNNIERLSLEELEIYLDKVESFQELILKHKGKIKNDEKNNYVTLIVDLRWKLAGLYEDRVRENELTDYLKNVNRTSLTNKQRVLLENREELHSDIITQTKNIKNIYSRYNALEKNNIKEKFNYKKYLNRMKLVKKKRKYVTVPRVQYKFIKDNSFIKNYLKYKQRKLSKSIDNVLEIVNTTSLNLNNKKNDFVANIKKTSTIVADRTVKSTKEVKEQTKIITDKISINGNKTIEVLKETKNNITESLTLQRKLLIAQSRLNKIKNIEKRKVFKIKTNRKVAIFKRESKLKLNKLNKVSKEFMRKTKKSIKTMSNSSILNLIELKNNTLNLIKKTHNRIKPLANNVIAKSGNLLSKIGKKGTKYLQFIKGVLEVALFKNKYRIKIGIENISKILKSLKRNSSNKKTNIIENFKDDLKVGKLKINDGLTKYIQPKRQKTNTIVSNTKSKAKKFYTNVRGDLEALVFRVSHETKIFVEENKTVNKPKLENLKNKILSSQNKNIFTKTAVLLLMISIGISSGLIAKRHTEEKTYQNNNNNNIEYEANEEILANNKGFGYTLINPFEQEMDMMNIVFTDSDLEMEEEIEEPEKVEIIDEPELPEETIIEPNLEFDDHIENIEEPELFEENVIEPINDQINIGKDINILEGSKLYTNIYDTYLGDNGLKPYYSDQEMLRTISTVIISNGDDLVIVNDNEELSSYLDNNYEIVGCGVTNQYSQNGTIEGYYQVDSILTNSNDNIQKTLI